MLLDLQTNAVLTRTELMEKYASNYIGYVLIERFPEEPDSDRCLPICLVDSYNEVFSVPRKTREGRYISFMPGYAVGGTEIGGVYFDE